MRKLFFILFFLSITIFARENPFAPQNSIPIPELVKPPVKIKKLQPVITKIEKEIKVKEIPKKSSSVWLKKDLSIPKKREIHKAKPKKIKIKRDKPHKRVSRSKLIYNGKFAKVKLNTNSIKIYTKDHMLKQLKLKRPNRIIIDLERFDVVRSFSKNIRSKYIRRLRIGHHDYFYRMTFTLAKNRRYRVLKKPYGYLIKLF